MSPGWRAVPCADNPELRELVRLGEEETRQDWEWEQSDGWRGKVASGVSYLPWSVQRKGTGLYWRGKRSLEHKRAVKQIGHTRWLHFSSPYILETGFCGEVEGYLYATDEAKLPFTIVASGAIEQSAKVLWAEGDVLQDYHMGSGVNIVVPVKHLNQEDILRAIQHWYVSEYGNDPLHWSNREGQLPNLYLDLTWQDWREYDPLWLPEESKDWDDQQYKKYRSQNLQQHMRQARARGKQLREKFNLD